MLKSNDNMIGLYLKLYENRIVNICTYDIKIKKRMISNVHTIPYQWNEMIFFIAPMVSRKACATKTNNHDAFNFLETSTNHILYKTSLQRLYYFVFCM